ncbi:MAG: hypothetical protein ABI364_00650, partial [Caldimonas sp.]
MNDSVDPSLPVDTTNDAEGATPGEGAKAPRRRRKPVAAGAPSSGDHVGADATGVTGSGAAEP